MPVTLSAAKGLARRTQRSWAQRRMTTRTPLKSAHGKSSLHMSTTTNLVVVQQNLLGRRSALIETWPSVPGN